MATNSEVITKRKDAIAPAICPAVTGSSSTFFEYSGMKAADKAPSPRRFCRTLGIFVAAAKASPTNPIPKILVTKAARTKPEIRDKKIAVAATLALAEVTVIFSDGYLQSTRWLKIMLLPVLRQVLRRLGR